jgi:hypothetical protein
VIGGGIFSMMTTPIWFMNDQCFRVHHFQPVSALILEDLIGERSCIYVKYENGLYADDLPQKNSEAKFIFKISARTGGLS